MNFPGQECPALLLSIWRAATPLKVQSKSDCAAINLVELVVEILAMTSSAIGKHSRLNETIRRGHESTED